MARANPGLITGHRALSSNLTSNPFPRGKGNNRGEKDQHTGFFASLLNDTKN
jgi:hypothetical protein